MNRNIKGKPEQPKDNLLFIKITILTKTNKILNKINKQNPNLTQFIRNLLNICNTEDEVLYVTPKFILEESKYFTRKDIYEISNEFKAKYESIKNKHSAEYKFFNNLRVFYYLAKN